MLTTPLTAAACSRLSVGVCGKKWQERIEGGREGGREGGERRDRKKRKRRDNYIGEEGERKSPCNKRREADQKISY